MGAEEEEEAAVMMIFTYGTLKRGFSNHGLMQEMIRSGDASFIGAARTCDPLPLVCGPYRVPFLLNLPGLGLPVRGEVYAVSPRALALMDDLEGTSRSHYERLPITIALLDDDDEYQEGSRSRSDGQGSRSGSSSSSSVVVVEAEAYYAHRSYAAELWRRSGERGFAAYSEKEATGYVKRKDRPQDITFLDQIRIFVASQN